VWDRASEACRPGLFDDATFVMSDIELAKNIGFGVVAVGIGMVVVMFAEHIAHWLLGL
jgi:hypothetical protein